MEAYDDATFFTLGVGATAEAGLATLTPLIEYYEREMGELPGRLMMAASFLEDIKLMDRWNSESPEAQAAVEQAKALVVSVMVRLLHAQQECSCALESDGDAGGAEQKKERM